MWLMAFGSLALLVEEVFSNNPRILFGRFLWVDELWTKFIESKPSVWQSLIALKHAGDPAPPRYHLLARASWGLLGGSAETAFRTSLSSRGGLHWFFSIQYCAVYSPFCPHWSQC
jgi:hypothetical protein